ncbi:centrosome assembly protein spindle defective 2 isoform X2 [Lycorma delicatula]|uniref:centrosome assembly protein spindle defective 2 isoform X2 n=1 Tax=Lycorma delicatula TaxID=130591 RepID=UPI003F518230
MADYTPHLANKFVDDTLISTPKPQATSTVDHHKRDDCSLISNRDTSLSGDDDAKIVDDNNDKFLVNERNLVGSLKKQLDQVIANIHRESCATRSDVSSSSLGILKLDDMEDIGACDTSEELDKLIPKKEEDCEISWKMTRELARHSISSRKSSLTSSRSTNHCLLKPQINKNINLKLVQETNDESDKIKSKSANKYTRESFNKIINPFDGERYSVGSITSEEFTSGENVASRLLKDEVAWMKEKAEIPVVNYDKSLSGIYPDDRLSCASNYLRQGSGPLGTLDGNVDSDSRPNFGSKIFSPIRRDSKTNHRASYSTSGISYPLLKYIGSTQQNNDNTLDEIPTKEFPLKDNLMSADNERSTYVIDNKIDENCILMGNNCETSASRLSVSSVASITHIAELLGDMSVNTNPRIIIDKMLSAGMLDKFTEVGPVNRSSDVSAVSCNDGKENLHRTVWVSPSRMTSTAGENLNDLDSEIFKLPDSKLLKKRKVKNSNKSISGKDCSVLSDATNTYKKINTKKNSHLVFDAESMNKTIFISDDDDDDDDTNRRISDVTECDKITHNTWATNSNSDSDLSDLNIALAAFCKDNTGCFSNSNFMKINGKLLRMSSNKELNYIKENVQDEFNDVYNEDSVVVENKASIDNSVSNASHLCGMDYSECQLASTSDLHCNTDINVSDLSCRNSSSVNDVMCVCIGTLIKCTIPLQNTSSNSVKKCHLSVKKVMCNGSPVPIASNIVQVYFTNEIILKPDSSENIEVYLVPLISKLIEVWIEVKMTSVDCDNELSEQPNITLCIMKVIGKNPKIEVEYNSLTESSVSGLNFGVLPEESIKKLLIKLCNTGDVRVPILLEISESSSDILVFYLVENDENGKEEEVLKKVIILEPGEVIEEAIFCFTPPLNSNTQQDSCKICQVSGKLTVTVASTETHINLPALAQLPMLAVVGLTRVLIRADCNPLMVPAYGYKPLVICNAGITPVTLKLHCDNDLFSTIGGQMLSLEPDQNGMINIEFKPNRPNFNNSSDRNAWKGTLWLSIESSEIRYSVDLLGEECNVTQKQSSDNSSSSGSSTTTPIASRSSSPSSSCSRSSSVNLGPLDLACTCSALVWSSCPLLQGNNVNKKSCVLRNKQNQREKLLLTISDPLSCYKIVEEKGTCVSEMRMNLEAMESRQITINFNPTQVGPCKASLIITRAQQKSASLPTPFQKKVLHLYGYGGKAVLNIKGVFRDPDLRMWTYLDSDTLQSTFTLENNGDGTAFVKLGQEIAATGVTIKPQECLIAAHKSVYVELTFSPTVGRADHLLAEHNNVGDMLNVTRITITHGDEATRLRLKRLYSRLISEKQQADNLLMERLATLSNLFPGTSICEVAVLKDKLESMKTLWLEGIRENTLGVILERSALENAQLDSTAQFIDLATTIMDETVYNNKLPQLIVAPRIVNLSPSQPISSFSLRNTTVLQSRFHIEIPQLSTDLIIEPRHGSLPPHTSCLLTVKHSVLMAPSASSLPELKMPLTVVVKVHSDLMNVIEVPVNINNIIKPASTKTAADAIINSDDKNKKRKVYSDDYKINFPATFVGCKTVCRICLRNPSNDTAMVVMEKINGPFEMRTLEFPLKGSWYLNFKVYFKPLEVGKHVGTLTISVDKCYTLTYYLFGLAVIK